MAKDVKVSGIRIITVTALSRSASRAREIAQALEEEVTRAGHEFVRHVSTKGEAEPLQTLLTEVSHANEADVLLVVGGTGFSVGDNSVEALEAVFDRRIEGFSEAYRSLLRGDEVPSATAAGTAANRSVRAMLARATAGAYKSCIAVAFSAEVSDVRHVLQTLVLPALPEAVARATSRSAG